MSTGLVQRKGILLILTVEGTEWDATRALNEAANEALASCEERIARVAGPFRQPGGLCWQSRIACAGIDEAAIRRMRDAAEATLHHLGYLVVLDASIGKDGTS